MAPLADYDPVENWRTELALAEDHFDAEENSRLAAGVVL